MRLSPKFLQTLRALCIASCCGVAYGHNPLVRAEEPLTFQTSTPLADEARRLLDAGSAYAKEKQYDKAIESWEKVMAMPVPPGAHKPGGLPYPGPIDWRGEARWNIAETRRAQGRWQEALDLYQINRKEYPRSDGCVFSGAAIQGMMLAEGECFEHLGRTAEAVRGYWIAAILLEGNIPPRAMRRLIELYMQAGQMNVLKSAIERETKKIPFDTLSIYTGQMPPEPLEYAMKQRLDERIANSFIPVFRQIVLFQQAVRDKNWPVLVAEMDALKDNEQHEAVVAMATVSKPPLRILNAALKRAPQNAWLQAAILFYGPSQVRDQWLKAHENMPDTITLHLERLLSEGIVGMQPFSYSKPAPKLPLPTELPPVIRAQIEL